MPCNSDYLNQSGREAELQRAAKLLRHALERLGRDVPEWVLAADVYYATETRSVPMLCEVLTGMTKTEREAIIYDAHNKTARNLADWWEKHQAADKARIESEERTAERKKLKASAIGKLSQAEREAIGLG